MKPEVLRSGSGQGKTYCMSGKRKEEEGRDMSERYQRQGDQIRSGLFTDTSKTTAGIFCAHFLDNPGTLYLSGGACTMPYLDLIELNDYLQVFYNFRPW